MAEKSADDFYDPARDQMYLDENDDESGDEGGDEQGDVFVPLDLAGDGE